MRAIKKRTAGKMKGAGITARRIRELNSDDWNPIFEADDRMKAELGREPDYFDWIAFGPLKWAEEVLRATGKRIVIPGLEWDADVLEQAEKPKPDSPEDFAQKMIAAGVKARRAIKEGNAAKAAYHAFNLGELVEAIRIKEIWENPALLGKRRLEQIKEWSARRRASREDESKDEWLAIARKYDIKKGYSYVADQIIKEIGLDKKKHQTIRKWLAKNFKK